MKTKPGNCSDGDGLILGGMKAVRQIDAFRILPKSNLRSVSTDLCMTWFCGGSCQCQSSESTYIHTYIYIPVDKQENR